jgi:hypothetical protein
LVTIKNQLFPRGSKNCALIFLGTRSATNKGRKFDVERKCAFDLQRASKTSTITAIKNTPERITQKMTHEVEIWTQAVQKSPSKVGTKQAANEIKLCQLQMR